MSRYGNAGWNQAFGQAQGGAGCARRLVRPNRDVSARLRVTVTIRPWWWDSLETKRAYEGVFGRKGSSYANLGTTLTFPSRRGLQWPGAGL